MVSHTISRKYQSLLEGIYKDTKSEKIASFITFELYNNHDVFNPDLYILGNFIKGYKGYLVIDSKTTFIVLLKDSNNDFFIYDLHGIIDYTISYISIQEHITIVAPNKIDNIKVEFIDKNKIKFKWC